MGNLSGIPRVSLLKDKPGHRAAVALGRTIDDALRSVGAVLVHNPAIKQTLQRRNEEHYRAYFHQSSEQKEPDEVRDHQVGWTPACTEIPLRDKELIRRMRISVGQLPIQHEGRNKQERFFVEIGPGSQKFVVPAIFQEGEVWHEVIVPAATQLLETAVSVLELFAIANDLPVDTFTSMMTEATHRLGATGSDLSKYGNPNTVLAGWHTDLNLITVSSKSSSPGLVIWTNEKPYPISANLPDGYLLIQAGKQLEHLTGGAVMASLHEVVVTEETGRWIAEQRKTGGDLWRISSGLIFAHVEEDALLEPLDPFATPEACMKYPKTTAGAETRRIIEKLGLAASK